jgi:hypothetical protein
LSREKTTLFEGHEPAEQILPTPIPAQAHDPARMPSQVCHLLSRCRVVDSDNLCIAGSSEVLVGWAESDSSHGLDESAERMGHLARGVVEDVDAAVLVA